ncbi:MAG: hypothetical protein OEY19_12225 [Gammaproteobacteria bacterium]|nr:hypothetical protein [Gammaproteobacteria bacterium]
MINFNWYKFFEVATDVLGEGNINLENSKSFCAWTTFGALKSTCNYWFAGLPCMDDLDSRGHGDGGVWRQPFDFDDLAHIVIPKEFMTYLCIQRSQNIETLSEKLHELSLEHRCTNLVLEVKLY